MAVWRGKTRTQVKAIDSCLRGFAPYITGSRNGRRAILLPSSLPPSSLSLFLFLSTRYTRSPEFIPSVIKTNDREILLSKRALNDLRSEI